MFDRLRALFGQNDALLFFAIPAKMQYPVDNVTLTVAFHPDFEFVEDIFKHPIRDENCVLEVTPNGMRMFATCGGITDAHECWEIAEQLRAALQTTLGARTHIIESNSIEDVRTSARYFQTAQIFA